MAGFFVSSLFLPENDRWLSARHTSLFTLVAFRWAPLLRLFPITLKWINSVFEFIIREDMDFTNEIMYSWQITIKAGQDVKNITCLRLHGLKLPVVNPLLTQTFDFTFFVVLSFLCKFLFYLCVLFYHVFRKVKTHNQLFHNSTLHFNVSVDASSSSSLQAPWNVDMKHVSGLHPWIIFGLQPEGISVESMPFCFLLLRRFCTNIYQVANYCTLCAQAYAHTNTPWLCWEGLVYAFL